MELTINGQKVSAREGVTLLQAAREAGITIPSLCSHPDVPATKILPEPFVYHGLKRIFNDHAQDPACGLCLVQIHGRSPVRACETIVETGMVVSTQTDEVRQMQKNRLGEILRHHPSICLTCDRDPRCPPFGVCVRSANVPDRCVACPGYGDCELIKIADHLGMTGITVVLEAVDFPVVDDNPFLELDPKLCVGCTRCVRFCRDVRGIGALGYVFRKGRAVAGTKAETFLDSGCRFCFGCVEVCPTGALVDKKEKWKPALDRDEQRKNRVPCMAACPLQIDIPGYIHAIAGKNHDRALSIIEEKLPFPSLCGTVCTHPCETACRRGDLDKPVSIRNLKRFVVENTVPPPETPPRTLSGKKVAVVGSGPAGLAAAYYLRKTGGHEVVVFDALSRPGGMFFAGIPRFRLPEEVLDGEIRKLRQLGVRFVADHRVTSVDDLMEQGVDAILLAMGAQGEMRLGVPGEDHPAIMGSVRFLRRIHSDKDVLLGNRVAVIGGGNVALDAARTAKRLGAEEVTVLYRRTRNEMPAHAKEIALAEEEGVQFSYLASPTGFEASGSKIQIHCIRYKLKRLDASGRPRPKSIKGSEFSFEVDSVLTAVGQYAVIPGDFGLQTDVRGRIKVSEEAFMTNQNGVFAAGDVVTGPKTATHAVAMGTRAADAIDLYLGGRGITDLTDFNPSNLSPKLEKGGRFLNRRNRMPILPLAKRLKNFNQVETGFSEETALNEANRCLRCSLRLKITKTNP